MNTIPLQQQPRPSLITTVKHHVGNFFNYLTSLRKGYKSGSANAMPANPMTTNAIPTGGKKTRRNRRSKQSKRSRTRKHNKTKKRKH